MVLNTATTGTKIEGGTPLETAPLPSEDVAVIANITQNNYNINDILT